jgi:hypothetical protein
VSFESVLGGALRHCVALLEGNYYSALRLRLLLVRLEGGAVHILIAEGLLLGVANGHLECCA